MTVTRHPGENPEVMGIREAAEFLGVGEHTLQCWMAQKRVPHAEAGGRVLFRRQALLDWLEKQERESMGGEGPCRLPELSEE